jgi:hypothetical protein
MTTRARILDQNLVLVGEPFIDRRKNSDGAVVLFILELVKAVRSQRVK